MEALLFADRKGHDLLPLTRRLPVSILPVNGKALVEYSLEDLAAADVRSAMVVLGENDTSVRETLGSGSRWNLDLKFVHSNQGETPTEVARRFAGEMSESFLALRGDVFRVNTVQSF